MALSKAHRRWGALFLLACLCVVLSYLLSRTDFFQVVEMKTVDFRFRLLGQQDTASSDIVLSEIDDNSIKLLEPAFGRWPWPRDAHAYFLDFMRRAGARLVVYDVLFTEADLVNPGRDEEFVEATRRTQAVIHAVALGDQANEQITGKVDPDLLEKSTLEGNYGFLEFIQADYPIPGLARAAQLLGHVANALDSDGPFRHYLLMAAHRYIDDGGSEERRTLPSLALAAALAVRGLELKDIEIEGSRVRAGEIQVELNQDQRLPIWFNGGPGTYTSVPYGQVVYSELQILEGEVPGIDPEFFRDKIVMVGVSGTGLYDMFTTPYAGTRTEVIDETGVRLGKMAGVEVHANVVDNLLHGRYLTDVPRLVTWLIGVGITFLVLTAVFVARLPGAMIASLALLVGYLWVAQYLFSQHVRIPVAPAVLCWALAISLGFTYQYWVEGAEKRKVKAIFSRYVSRDVYQQLLDDPDAARLGGRRMTVTVLFSDLRGFTSLSENRAPEDIVALLNEYFSAMVTLVFEHRGTIDKFVGDMIMALFNAPLEDEIHADHAVQCAIAMQKKLTELNRDWQARGMPELAAGVGINTGEMIAGNVGAETIRSYTVIGDNVNLGARLESLCKEYQSNIIISEFTRQQLKEAYDLVELGDVVVKGKSRPVKIFQVKV